MSDQNLLTVLYDFHSQLSGLNTSLFSGPETFTEKNVLLFGKTQTVEDGLETVLAADALAGINLKFEDQIFSNVIPYGETATGRTSAVSITNIIRKISFYTLVPILPVGETVTEDSLPLTAWLKACGAKSSVVDNTLTFSNEEPIDARLFLEIHRIPDKDVNKRKSYGVQNSVGIVGLVLEAGRRSQLTFEFSGNPVLPNYGPKIWPNFGQQKSRILEPLNRNNIIFAELTDLQTNVLYNICFYKLETDNLFGFKLENPQLSCSEAPQLVPEAGLVALTVLLSSENSIATVTPEFCLERKYSLRLKLGTTYPVEIQFSELCLLDYKQQKIGEVAGMSMGFLSTGTLSLSFSTPPILE